jgi:hypothetical protein
MAYPTVVQVTKLQESALTTQHSLQGFDDVQAGDVLYAVACISTMIGPAATGWGSWSYWQYKVPGSSGKNQALTVLRMGEVNATGDEDGVPLVITTGSPRLVAAVGIQVRGAGITPVLGYPNKDEATPWNFGQDKAPGVTGVARLRIPDRSSDGTAGPDSKVLAAFARVGSLAFRADIDDDMGAGISEGAPYLATAQKDMRWGRCSVGCADGSNVSPFAVADHAESTDGSWKCQVGISHRDVPTAEFGGHNWDTVVYGGSCQLTYWPCNATGGGAAAIPTGLLGLRIRS